MHIGISEEKWDKLKKSHDDYIVPFVEILDMSQEEWVELVSKHGIGEYTINKIKNAPRKKYPITYMDPVVTKFKRYNELD
jgi:hypothetical protein